MDNMVLNAASRRRASPRHKEGSITPRGQQRAQGTRWTVSRGAQAANIWHTNEDMYQDVIILAFYTSSCTCGVTRCKFQCWFKRLSLSTVSFVRSRTRRLWRSIMLSHRGLHLNVVCSVAPLGFQYFQGNLFARKNFHSTRKVKSCVNETK